MSTATVTPGTTTVPRINDVGPGFHRRNYTRHDQLSRVDRRRLGDPVFAPEGFYSGLHHRTRLHGGTAARICQAQYQDYRVKRGPGEQPRKMGCRHRRDPGPQGELSR